MNIGSDKIKIYPVSNRKIVNDSGDISQYGFLEKLNIEQNIIEQKNNLVDSRNYFIDTAINLKSNTLVINSGRFVLNGYIFTLNKPINISLSAYVDTANISYWVYFTINLIDKGVKYNQSITLNQKQLDGSDTVLGIYNGLELNISDIYPELNPSENTYNFPLAILHYDGTKGWSLFKDNNLYNKVRFNNMLLDLDASKGITKVNGTQVADNWLKENFIIDDGDIV